MNPPAGTLRTRHDRRGVPITTSSPDAVDCFEAATIGFVSHRRDTAERLDAALAADPGLIPALCLRGFAYKALASRAFEPQAKECLSAARAALAAHGGNGRERGLVEALAHWCGGDTPSAARTLERTLRVYPRDLLSFKLHHAVSFMLGRPHAMRAAAERALRSWDPALPGYGFVLGCYAFSLEETFDRQAAERVGRTAVELEPADAWGAHAVAHVLEAQDRALEGLAFMDAVEPGLRECNNFGGHLAWHRGLFHLQLGELDAALALHDQRIAHHLGRDYRDTCNAATLLWRVSHEGLAVGERWQKLAALARAHIGDHGSAFADGHYALALAAAGDGSSAGRFVSSMRASAAVSGDHASGVVSAVGVPLASGIVALYSGRARDAVRSLLSAERELGRVGGSHAQRDVFECLTIDAALHAGDRELARCLIDRRLAARPANRFARLQLQKLARSRSRAA
jgi:tetratricopeptide (TPR) repeat protein